MISKMAHNSDVCRFCLAFDVRLVPITGILQEVFEKLTNTALHTSDELPEAVCYICHAQLKKCYKLMLNSAKAENVMTSLLASHNKITKSLVSQFDHRNTIPFGKLNISSLKYVDLDISHPEDVTTVEIEIESELPVEHIKSEIIEDLEDPSQASEMMTPNVDSGINEGSKDENFPSVSNGESQIIETEVKIEIKRELTEDEDADRSTGSPALPPEGLIVCPYCRRGFHVASDFVAHIRMHREGMPTEEINSIPIEPPLPPNPEDGLINCKYCERKFKFSSDFQRHIRMHTGERPYSCNLCDLRFKLRSHLKRHSKTHTDEKPHKCQICQRTFNELSSLKRHYRYHTGEKPYECDICHRKFSELSSMKRHTKIHTGQKNEKHFVCDSCQRRFVNAYSLKKHASIHTRKLQCSACGCEFEDDYSLQVHMRSHSEKHICDHVSAAV